MGTAKLSGAANGVLSVRLKPELARELTGQALGLNQEDVGPDVIKELIGQVVNIVADTMNSNFASAGLNCKLETGEVTQGKRTPRGGATKGAFEPLAFQYQGHPIWFDIVVGSSEPKTNKP